MIFPKLFYLIYESQRKQLRRTFGKNTRDHIENEQTHYKTLTYLSGDLSTEPPAEILFKQKHLLIVKYFSTVFRYIYIKSARATSDRCLSKMTRPTEVRRVREREAGECFLFFFFFLLEFVYLVCVLRRREILLPFDWLVCANKVGDPLRPFDNHSNFDPNSLDNNFLFLFRWVFRVAMPFCLPFLTVPANTAAWKLDGIIFESSQTYLVIF